MSKLRDFFKALMDEDASGPAAPVYQFAAGKECRIECGRSGTFRDMHGTKATMTPVHLAAMVSSFDPERDHKIKIGHVPIDTTTPDYGDVVRLEYSETRDRLYAFAVPTEITVEKNRKEGFKRCSMEATQLAAGGFDFEHLALLGARRPAISGLEPIALAQEAGEGTFVMVEGVPDPEPEVFEFAISAKQREKVPAEDFAGPDQSFPIRNQEDVTHAAQLLHHAKDQDAVKQKIIAIAKRKGLKLPESWEEEDKEKGKKIAAAGAGDGGLDTPETVEGDRANKDEKEKAVELAEKQKLERLEKLVREGARDRAKAFIAANQKKIPLKLVQGGLEDQLTALFAMDVENESAVLKFAGADGKEKQLHPGELVTQMLASLPDQVTPEEGKDTTKDGPDDKDKEKKTDNVREFGPRLNSSVKFAESEFDKKVTAYMAAHADEKLTYAQAAEIVSSEEATAAK